MAEIYANNVRGKLAQPILAADTSITLQAGHNFIDPGSNWYRATLYRWEFTGEGIREYDHEVVKVTALAGDVLTVERELEGTALAFEPDTPIELRMTAGTAAAIEARAGQALIDHEESEDPHGQYLPRTGADLGSNDLKARLTHNSGYFYIGSFSSAYGEGQLRAWFRADDKQLNLDGAELTNVSLNASLLDKGTIPIDRIASTGNRFNDATDVLLQANAMNNHRTSADHDDRYPLKANTGTAASRDVQSRLTDTTAGRLLPYGAFGLGEVENYSPTGVNIDSAESPNGFWRADSSRQTSAHWPFTPFIGGMFQTRTGANSAVYQMLLRAGRVWFRTNGDDDFTEMFHEGNTTQLKAAAGLDNVKNIAFNWQFGDSTPTHFWASQGSSQETYVYGAAAIRAGLGLGGAALAGISSSRTSTSTDHALTAAAMNSHRLSGDHDGRYAPASGFDSIGSYTLAQFVQNQQRLRGELVAGSNLSPAFTALDNGVSIVSSIRVSGTWMCMGRAEGTQQSNVTLWQRVS